MPYDQIYWNSYGGSSFAASGFTEFSNAHDVRYGETATEDSHSGFSFAGKRRKYIQDFFQLLIRDDRHPFNFFDIASKENGISVEYWTTFNSPMVYGWPGVSTYGTKVSKMTVDDIASVYSSKRDKSGTTEHSTSTDDLFQAQNRESCHHLSNSALSNNISHPFVGIHKDNPLKLTTTKSYKGYRLILKRRRFYYNECGAGGNNLGVRLIHIGSTRGHNQFIDSWDANHPNGAAPMSWIANAIDGTSVSGGGSVKYPLTYNRESVANSLSSVADLKKLFRSKIPRTTSAKGVDRMVLTTKPSWLGKLNGEEVYPCCPSRSNNPFLEEENGYDWDDEISVQDAVIHNDYNTRLETHTGSVYLKNITIKAGGTVLSAQNDIKGQYAEMSSSNIYTDRGTAIKATSSGAGNKTITFSNLYSNKTTIIERYISKDFKIKFAGDATEYAISSVAAGGNKITLSSNLGSAIINSAFTLLIPRGSTNSDYTWGNYKLTNFDGDTYDTTVCDKIRVNFNPPSSVVSDLIRNTPTVNTGSGSTFHTVMNSNQEGTGGGKQKVPIRHPYWSNELSEALHIKNDFSCLAYWTHIYWHSNTGHFMHISSKVNSATTNVSWSKCNWVKYWEQEHTNDTTDSTAEYKGSGYSNLKTSEIYVSIFGDKDLQDDDLTFNIKEFHHGGLDEATGSLWPSYKNNIASLNGKYLNNGTFTTTWASWAKEFEEAYGSKVSKAEQLDKCFFSGCAIKVDPSIRAFYQMSSRFGSSLQGFDVCLLLSMCGAGYTNNVTNNGNQWAKEIKHKCEKTLLHPWTLAQYGFETDMLGWNGYLAGKQSRRWPFHTFTIYDSDAILSTGTDIEVSLQQASNAFSRELEDDLGNLQEEGPFLGDGQGTKPIDNYQLFIVAK